MNYAVKAVKDHFKKLERSVESCEKMREVVEAGGESDFATISVTNMDDGAFGNQVGLELNLNDSTEKRLVREFINDIAAYRAESLAIANVNRGTLEASAKVIDELSTPKAGDR